MIEIRPYEPRDHHQVVELWRQVFADEQPHNEPSRMLEDKVAMQDGLLLVAVLQKTVVGSVMTGYDGHRGWLYALAVSQACRRQKTGSRLVQQAVNLLKARGCNKLNLQIREDNANVRAFYESLGFDVEPRISMGRLI